MFTLPDLNGNLIVLGQLKKKDALNLKYYLELDLKDWHENNVINRDKD